MSGLPYQVEIYVELIGTKIISPFSQKISSPDAQSVIFAFPSIIKPMQK